MKNDHNCEHRGKRKTSKTCKRFRHAKDMSHMSIPTGSTIEPIKSGVEFDLQLPNNNNRKRRRLISKYKGTPHSDTCSPRNGRKSFHSLNLPTRHNQNLLDCQVRRRALSDTAKTLKDSLSPYYTVATEKRKTKLPSKYDHMFLLGLSRRRVGSYFETFSETRVRQQQHQHQQQLCSFDSSTDTKQHDVSCLCSPESRCADSKTQRYGFFEDHYNSTITPLILGDEGRPKLRMFSRKRRRRVANNRSKTHLVLPTKNLQTEDQTSDNVDDHVTKRSCRRAQKTYWNSTSDGSKHKATTVKITKLTYRTYSAYKKAVEASEANESTQDKEDSFSLPCIADVEISTSTEWKNNSTDSVSKSKCHRRYGRRKTLEFIEKPESEYEVVCSPPIVKKRQRKVSSLKRHQLEDVSPECPIDSSNNLFNHFLDATKETESLKILRSRRNQKISHLLDGTNLSLGSFQKKGPLLNECEYSFRNSLKVRHRGQDENHLYNDEAEIFFSDKCDTPDDLDNSPDNASRIIRSSIKRKCRPRRNACHAESCSTYEPTSKTHSRCKKEAFSESFDDTVRKCVEDIIECISYAFEKRGRGRPRKTLIDKMNALYPNLIGNLCLSNDFLNTTKSSARSRKKLSGSRMSVSETNSSGSSYVAKSISQSVQRRSDLEQNSGECGTSFERFAKPRPSDLPAKDIEVFDHIMNKFAHNANGSSAVNLPDIVFGEYEIKSWYRAPYPAEYANVEKLYICEFCLSYMKSERTLARHSEKCETLHPPGNQIYGHESLSVFEVDGKKSTNYCQNLCLLAKLFLDHKTLHSDVEPFLFYVLTTVDEFGHHLIGYFSKEKLCVKKFNVSCIMVLPQHQRKGYGTFLIDFSYLLSRKEGLVGTPERPLSDLGKLSYESYWKAVIVRELNSCKSVTSFRELSNKTAIAVADIFDTVRRLNLVTKRNDEFIIIRLTNSSCAVKQPNDLWPTIKEDCLRWTPPVFVNEGAEDDDAEGSIEEITKPRLETSLSTSSSRKSRPRTAFERRSRRSIRKRAKKNLVKYRRSRKLKFRKIIAAKKQPSYGVTRRRSKLRIKSSSQFEEKEADNFCSGNPAAQSVEDAMCNPMKTPSSDWHKEADCPKSDEVCADVITVCQTIVDSVLNEKLPASDGEVHDREAHETTQNWSAVSENHESFDAELDNLVADIFEIEERERKNSETSHSSKSRSRTSSIASPGCVSSPFSNPRSNVANNSSEQLHHTLQSAALIPPSKTCSSITSSPTLVCHSPPVQSRYNSRSCSPSHSSRCISTPSPGVLPRPSSTSPGLKMHFAQSASNQLVYNKLPFNSPYSLPVDPQTASLRLPYDQNFCAVSPQPAPTPYMATPFAPSFDRSNVFSHWSASPTYLNNTPPNLETFPNIYNLNSANMNNLYVTNHANAGFPFANGRYYPFVESDRSSYGTNILNRPAFNLENYNEVFNENRNNVFSSNFGTYHPPK